ncbi:hypothetical protein ANCCAN_25615 [Ancylostoma caninum]|uniref:Uncharacterized protein n=1 Tax=Ancylostoma caninum TaxID=29170 RepID=A0A368FCA2_ANCCA|nr:hypothetical protein ANCCAN_25615 [Ancylostoma caninum]
MKLNMKPLMLKYYNYPHVVNNLVMMTVICALSMLYYRSVSRLSDISNSFSFNVLSLGPLILSCR